MNIQKRRKQLELKRRQQQLASLKDAQKASDGNQKLHRFKERQSNFDPYHDLGSNAKKSTPYKKKCNINNATTAQGKDFIIQKVRVPNQSQAKFKRDQKNHSKIEKRYNYAGRPQSMSDEIQRRTATLSDYSRRQSYHSCPSSTRLLSPKHSLFQNAIYSSASSATTTALHFGAEQHTFQSIDNSFSSKPYTSAFYKHETSSLDAIFSRNLAMPQDISYEQLSPVKVCHSNEETIHVFRRLRKSIMEESMAMKPTIASKRDLKVNEAEIERSSKQALRGMAFGFESKSPGSSESSPKKKIENGVTLSPPKESVKDKEVLHLRYSKSNLENGDDVNFSLNESDNSMSNVKYFNSNNQDDNLANNDSEKKNSNEVSQIHEGKKQKRNERSENTRSLTNDIDTNKSHKKKSPRNTTDGSNSVIQRSLQLEFSSLHPENSKAPTSLSRVSTPISLNTESHVPKDERPHLNRARTASISNLTMSSSDSSVDSFLTTESLDLSTNYPLTNLQFNGVRPRTHSIHSKSVVDDEENLEKQALPKHITTTGDWKQNDLVPNIVSQDSSSLCNSALECNKTKSTHPTCSCSSSTDVNEKSFFQSAINDTEDESSTINEFQEKDNIDRSFSSINNCKTPSKSINDRKLGDATSISTSNATTIYQSSQKPPSPQPLIRPPLASPSYKMINHAIDISQISSQSRPHLLSDQSSYFSSSSSESSNVSFKDLVSTFSLSYDESTWMEMTHNSSEKNAKGIPKHIYEATLSPPTVGLSQVENSNIKEEQAKLGFADDERVPKSPNKQQQSRSFESHTRSHSAGSIPLSQIIANENLGTPSPNAHLLSYSISVNSPDKNSLGNTMNSISHKQRSRSRSLSHNSIDNDLFINNFLDCKSDYENNEDFLLTKSKGVFCKTSYHRRHKSIDLGLFTQKKHRRRISESGKRRMHRKSSSGDFLMSHVLYRKGEHFDQSSLLRQYKGTNISSQKESNHRRSKSDGYLNHISEMRQVVRPGSHNLLSSQRSILSSLEEETILSPEKSLYSKDISWLQGSTILSEEPFDIEPTITLSPCKLSKEGDLNLNFAGSPNDIIHGKRSKLRESFIKSNPSKSTKTSFVSLEEFGVSCKRSSEAIEWYARVKSNWGRSTFVLGIIIGAGFLAFVFTSIVFFPKSNDSQLSESRITPHPLLTFSDHPHPSTLFVPFLVFVMTRKTTWALNYLYFNEILKRILNVQERIHSDSVLQDAIIGLSGILWAFVFVRSWKIPPLLNLQTKTSWFEWKNPISYFILYCAGCMTFANTNIALGISKDVKCSFFSLFSTLGLLGLTKVQEQITSEIYLIATLSFFFGMCGHQLRYKSSCTVLMILSTLSGPFLRRMPLIGISIGSEKVFYWKRMLTLACLLYGCVGSAKVLQEMFDPNNMLRKMLKREIVKSLKTLIKTVEDN